MSISGGDVFVSWHKYWFYDVAVLLGRNCGLVHEAISHFHQSGQFFFKTITPGEQVFF